MALKKERRAALFSRLLVPVVGLFLMSICIVFMFDLLPGGPFDGLQVNTDRNRYVVAPGDYASDPAGSFATLPPPTAAPSPGVTPTALAIDLDPIQAQQAALARQEGVRLIIKNGEIEVKVQDVDRAIGQVAHIAATRGGYVLKSASRGAGEVRSASIIIAVESSQFDDAMQDVREVAGQVLREESGGEDVSDEYVDLQSQLRNLEATRDRLQTFMADSASVTEALKVNTELSRIEAQIEQVRGRMQYLEGRAAYSLITVRLSLLLPTPTPTMTFTPTPTRTPTPPWSLGPYVKAAREDQTMLVRGLLRALVWLGMVPGPYVAGGAAIWLAARRVKRSRRKAAPAPEEPA